MDESTLDQIRESRGLKQAEVSKRLGLSQAAISKLEFRSDSYVSSVRKYVEALGGKLELRAVFGDDAVRIRGLDGDETITSLRDLLRGECRITPLDPSEGDFNNSFHLRDINDDERQITVEKDTGQLLQIPVRRVLEVLPPAAPHNLPTLVLTGVVKWIQPTQRWRFIE